MCITETWLCDDISESEFSIPGYPVVLNVIGTDTVVELYCLFLTSWNTRLQCGPKGLEFLLVSVHRTVLKRKCILVYCAWYQPPANSAALDDLYSIFESLDISVFSSFILLGDFNINFCNHHHPLF